jgi:cyclopropane fatty-acyl-phospholipid synthase-like methyltransferase
MSSQLSVDDKYKYYEQSVQNPDGEVETLQDLYRDLRGVPAKTLREDFCGTGAVMCEWVKQGDDFHSFGIDLDPEPIFYGKKNHLTKLNKKDQDRVIYHHQDVFKFDGQKADLAVALNFSYYIFKKRKQLVEYFSKVREGLNEQGIFVIDLFGGPESIMPLEEETDHGEFSYFWDCDFYNPIKNECVYYIHFRPKNGKKIEKVFHYDWRMWSFPELREVLEEAGFAKTIAYWEGDGDDGDGDGNFTPTESVENCEGWVGYIAALV